MKPSSKNTGSGLRPPKLPVTVHPAPLVRIDEQPSLESSQIATLQGQLVEEQDERKEERFLWFAACGLLFDVITFMGAGAGAGSVVTLVYVALLMILSKRWGFEGFAEALYDAKKLVGRQKDESGGEET